MFKLKNKKGFTLAEILVAFCFLTMSMTGTLLTLTTVYTITQDNRDAYLDLIACTVDFEDFTKDIKTIDDTTGLTVQTLLSSSIKSYTTFDIITTDNTPVDRNSLSDPLNDTPNFPLFYYNTGLVVGSTDPSYKLHNQTSSSSENVQVTVSTVKRTYTDIDYHPYYFVISILNERGVRYY